MENKERTFAGKRVLITGGAGFIGSHLARRLLALEAKVILVDSFIPAYGGNLANIADIQDRVRLNIADVRDPFSMRHLVQGVDYIFNLAGQTSHLDSMTDPFTDLEINSKAQLSILESLRTVNPAAKVVFASTRQIYGRPEYLPVDEDHPLRPVDVNGINKIAGESYHTLYYQVYGIRTASLRLTNTYGPAMRIKDARQTFLGVWVCSLLKGLPFEVWGGQQLRDFNYVDDVVEGLMAAALIEDTNGMALNLGGSEVVSLTALAELLIEVAGTGSFEIKKFPAERAKIDIGDYYSDYSKASTLLKWKPKISLREGLAKTVAYFEHHLNEYL